MSGIRHPEMAAGRWWELSVSEQLGNVGSEVSRTLKWRERNSEIARRALERALELLDLTLADPKHRSSVARLREIARAREVLLDFAVGPNAYHSDVPSLQRYFDCDAANAMRAKRLQYALG